MKRLICGFIKRWNQTKREAKIGGLIALLSMISLTIIIVKHYESDILILLLLLVGNFVIFPFAILYCTMTVYVCEMLVLVIKDKLKKD
ncbi:MAG TPA: hypothetical protein DCZ30_03600 [Clostridiales bacterium]|nr:hypothetical protein [Clostridiales bacterium]